MTTAAPPDDDDDELSRLIRRFRAGDPDARDELIRYTYDRFVRLTRRMLDGFPALRRWEQTDDVLHRALVRLVAALEVVTPASADHFLKLAALHIRRELLDLARHHFGPHGAAAHHDSAGGALPPAGPDPADGPATLAQWTEFHEAVAALPDDLREVVDLHFYQGLTHAAAGAQLGVDARTVKRRWSQALRLLAGRFPGGEGGGCAP